MVSIGICDDEAYMLELLAEKTAAFFAHENMDVEILRFSNGKALLEHPGRLDVLLLDIRMEQPDGLETARKLRQGGFDGFLIFVTVLEDHVFDAFDVEAFGYLVKPLAGDLFQRTMKRLLSALKTSRQAKLLVQKGKEWNIIRFDDIMYCEVIDRKVYLHLQDHTVLDYYDKLEKLERKLDSRFFRCHRSYLLNLQYLKTYKAGQARLQNDELIPVSRLRQNEFSSVLFQYMKKAGGGI